MAITPTNSLLTALSGLGIDGTRPRPAPAASAPSVQPSTRPDANSTGPKGAAAPDPGRPLPRGSIVNIVI